MKASYNWYKSCPLTAQLIAMLKNYWKAAIRSLLKNKTYSFLNLFGLSIGIACAAIIFLWVEDESSYDTQYPNRDRLAQLLTNQTYDGITRTFQSTPGKLAPALVKDIPGIKNASRSAGNRPLFSIGDKNIFEEGLYVDSSFLEMFSIPLIAGKASTAFEQVHSIVISEKMAKKFFANGNDALGKTIRVDNKHDYMVSGVFEDAPVNSTLQFEWLSPWAVFEADNGWLQFWGANGPRTFIQLAPNADMEKMKGTVADFIHSKEEKITTQVALLPMSDWRLRNNFVDGKQKGGRIEFVRLFGIIAWIILIIACINFMNLATARSAKRAKEVGVRKVLGAGKQTLVFQFIGEALLIAFISLLLGIVLTKLALPFFNTLVEKQIGLGLDNPKHIAAALGIAMFCGLAAGSYPSFYLSSFNPIYVFKGLKMKAGSALIRKSLVGFQFVVSIVLIICTILIYQQVNHIKNRNLGYSKDGLVELELTGKMKDKFSQIRQELINTGNIENAGLCNTAPLYTANNSSNYDWEGKEPNSDILVSIRNIDPNYLPTMQMAVTEGRNFRDDIRSDSSNVLITESFAALLGKGSALGKVIRNGDNALTVVGVVKDYVYGNMYGKPDPVIFYANPDNTNFMYVRLKEKADIQKGIAQLSSIVHNANPGYPVEYKFVNDNFNKLFKSETLIGYLAQIFSVLAIFISCLGLFGLSAFTAEQRTKEIGIRKVLGASVPGIVSMLSKDFLRIVTVAIIIAAPLAYYVMSHWLEDYAYRISISVWVFVAAGATAIFIAVGTISFQAVRAALVNPVRSLRSE